MQEAARIALNLRKRPDAKQLNRIAEAWRPWRGVAAHLMWAYYHVVKKRDGIGLQTKTQVAAKKHWPQIKKTKSAKKAKKATRKTAPVKRAKKAKGARRAN